ncbi:hypothetical protein OIK44_18950 [Janthinobacterium sp. hw3]|uniref:Uncharacterized protein n=1 Tax=Janthinobacterium fluminis TaxID=2987524 RepID=A0ABT5K3V2_9BURK|nr:hypothetical protein [Janthinobacterium fluminis]
MAAELVNSAADSGQLAMVLAAVKRDAGDLSKTQMDFGTAQCLGEKRAGVPAI